MGKSLSGELDVLFREVLSLPESSYDSYLIHQSYTVKNTDNYNHAMLF